MAAHIKRCRVVRALADDEQMGGIASWALDVGFRHLDQLPFDLVL